MQGVLRCEGKDGQPGADKPGKQIHLALGGRVSGGIR